MTDKSRPWLVPVVLFSCILVVGVGSVVVADWWTAPSGSYPERPATLDRTTVVDFVTEYERAYAREDLSRRYVVDQFTYDATNRSLIDQGPDGFVVHLAVALHWSGGQVEGDREYVANYFVSSSIVRRAEADSRASPGPDPRANGTTIEGR